jgi:DNA-directed RNA polymerase subunit RPC12/RpoP
MRHHVVQEQDLKHQCAYCSHDMGDDWSSQFDRARHYKGASCQNCGKQVTMKVDFDGSGHDDWAGHDRWKEKLQHEVRVRMSKRDDELMELVEEEFRYIEEISDEEPELQHLAHP